MEKLYDRIDWHNNTTPAINETNLNKMSKALDDLDDRVVLIAGDILVTVPELREMLEDCTELEQRLEAMTENPPYIGDNGHWYIWDTDTGAYVDSGIDASITVEIADITMLEPNATPYVTNTGTDTDPIFHLFIPRGQSGKGISSIAKTGTSGYVDTYTITYTDNTTTTYTVTNGRNTDQVTAIPTASAALVGTIYQYIGESTSSYTHGFYYECVNDGGVYKWVNIPVGNDPVAITSTDPYTYRQGKGNLADMEIVGASVGWNQLVQNGNFANGETNWEYNSYVASHSVANNVATFTPNAQNGQIKQTITRSIAGHKVLVAVSIKMASSTRNGITVVISDSFTATLSKSVTATTSWANYSSVYNIGSDFKQNFVLYVRDTNASDFQAINITNVQLIDLTLLFGSTIADAIYAMEQATAGSGVAFFRKYFSKDYYAYDAGSIQSVCVGSRKVVGKNLYNISDVKSTQNATVVGTGFVNTNTDTLNYIKFRCQAFDENGTQISTTLASENISTIGLRNYEIAIPKGTKYLRLAHSGSTRDLRLEVYTNIEAGDYKLSFNVKGYNPTVIGGVYIEDIMIRLANVEDSTFEPYTSTAYPFDSTKELRGMFDIVNGELKANGDVWRGDKIQRNWVEDDISTWNWTYNSSSHYYYTDGKASVIKKPSSSADIPNIISDKYTVIAANSFDPSVANTITVNTNGRIIVTGDTSPTGNLVYELATPTTESAQPYQNPQRAYIDGTEEFTDGLTRDVMIPVGNNTTYQQDKILPSIEDYVDAVAEVVKADILTTTNEEENVDLDTLTTPGMYFVKNSDAGSYNYPSSVTSGVLTVIHYKQSGETMIRQELQSTIYLCYRNGMWLNGSWVFDAGWVVFTGTI